MPLALIAIAIMLFIAGVTGNYAQVGTQFQNDVMGADGKGSFLQFMIGIIGIGAFFRLIGMPNAGRFFLVLVLIVYLMKNSNAITALENVTSGTPATGTGTSPATAATPSAAASPGAPLGLPGAVPATPAGSPSPAGGAGTGGVAALAVPPQGFPGSAITAQGQYIIPPTAGQPSSQGNSGASGY